MQNSARPSQRAPANDSPRRRRREDGSPDTRTQQQIEAMRTQQQQLRQRHQQQQRNRQEQENEDEFFEYEPASSDEEEKQDHDYNYAKEEFLNPVVIKLPDGTLNIGTESKDKHIREVLCWNCKSRLLYKHNFNQVMCYQCHEVVETHINNNPSKTFVKCLNCEQDLLVPEGAYKIFCTNCSNIFSLSKQTNQQRIDVLHFFAT